MTILPIRGTAAGSAALLIETAAIAARLARQQFKRHLDCIADQNRIAASTREDRADLPPEVIALAARVGVATGRQSAFASFDQTGQQAEAVWTLDSEEFVYWRGQNFHRVQPSRSGGSHHTGLSDEGAVIER